MLCLRLFKSFRLSLRNLIYKVIAYRKSHCLVAFSISTFELCLEI